MKKQDNTTKNIKKPWPTKDAMTQIYELGLWGSNASNFYSGLGSHDPSVLDPYIDAVKSFLRSFENPLVVCDLGCGDFNVGKELVTSAKKYVAVDIVEDLIDYNKETFIADNLEFYCLDIVVDDLCAGDCAIVRQVLQHLSNAEVKRVVNKLADFKYIILTEHVPEGDYEPNTDIISGQGIRLKKQSGLNLLEAPFNFKVKDVQQLLSIDLNDSKGRIVTYLYEVF